MKKQSQMISTIEIIRVYNLSPNIQNERARATICAAYSTARTENLWFSLFAILTLQINCVSEKRSPFCEGIIKSVKDASKARE